MHKILAYVLMSLALGASIGYTVGLRKARPISAEELNNLRPIRLNNTSYKFINPLLAYIIPPADQDTRFSHLKNEISDYINEEKKNGLTNASVFISDLNRGRWIGINENDLYPSASMFKVVILVAYLQGTEQISGLLEKKLLYAENLSPQTSLQVGKRYSVDELLNKMIIDSDNGAEKLLLNYMNLNFFDELFGLLGIQSFDEEGKFLISPRQYSLFFRIIYSATYLNSRFSEKALDILSKTTFDEGIVAGVPKGIVVSHKFGFYVPPNMEENWSMALHDCGIIYAKKGPYFLCVMTNGNDPNKLKSVIQHISFLTYQNYSEE